MASGYHTGVCSLRTMCVSKCSWAAGISMITILLVLSFLLFSPLEKVTGWEAARTEETSSGPHRQGTHLQEGILEDWLFSGVSLSPGKVTTPWFCVSHLTLTRGQRKHRTRLCLVPTGINTHFIPYLSFPSTCSKAPKMEPKMVGTRLLGEPAAVGTRQALPAAMDTFV